MAEQKIVKVEIRKIVVAKKREEDEAQFKKFVDSIDKIGMRLPVTLWTNEKGVLICSTGRRRMAAAKALGWKEVPALIIPDTEREAELWEIDENRQRKSLSALEDSEAVARRVELVEELFGEKPRGVRKGGTKAGGKSARGKAVEDTVEALGASERTVFRHLEVAKIAKAAKDKLRGTKAAEKQSELVALSKIPKSRQVRVATLMTKGATVKEADAQIRTKQKRGQQNWPDEFDDVMAKHRFKIMQFKSDIMKEKEKFLRWAKVTAEADPRMSKVADISQKLDAKFRAISYLFRDWIIPVGPCPYCKMKGCEECAGDGWVTEGTLRKAEQEDGKPPKKWII